MKYLKAIAPLVTGVVVGVVFLAFGYDVEGRSILLTAVAASGLVFSVPNRK